MLNINKYNMHLNFINPFSKESDKIAESTGKNEIKCDKYLARKKIHCRPLSL